MKRPGESDLRRGEAATWGSKPQPRQAKILRFTEYRNPSGTMLGFFSAELPSGQIIHSLKLMIGPAGKRWVGMPDVKRRDRTDQAMLNANGKAIWDPIIEFTNRDARDRFNAMILEALRIAHPELFDGEGDR